MSLIFSVSFQVENMEEFVYLATIISFFHLDIHFQTAAVLALNMKLFFFKLKKKRKKEEENLLLTHY